ncbi:MAG: DNA-binding protein [Porticoccus sp.]|nr:DNA-binding protein [Porticoccus sp.]|tara:strand:+ start:3917 stop:4978 length:1062 start_codon:yes stop_codon:yes gene_type:complete
MGPYGKVGEDMSFLNLGKKDEYGKQTRIEHRGKYLRASRTGGVSLRAQTRAAGLNLTANSSHGFRVSRTVGKNTQMVMQNGRFVLRGRYGSGPTKLNLSKTGMTVSTRNELGTFNWVKPNRSSAKLFGVQVRGKNAAYAQAAYLVLTAVATFFQLLIAVTLTLAQWGWQLLQLLWGLVLATPYELEVLRRKFRNRKIRRAQMALTSNVAASFEDWAEMKVVAAIALAFIAWGRGRDARAEIPWLKMAVTASNEPADLPSCLPYLSDAAGPLSQWHRSDTELDDPLPVLARTAILAELAARQVSADRLPAILLSIDDLVLQQGPKTRLQEQMLTVFCDFAGLRLQEESREEASN